MIIDDRQITDTLFEAVEQAMRFMISHIPVSFSFDGSLQRKERLAYPLPALREALINAVVHRDYSNASDIQIKIFDDKISIFSPGKLYGGLTVNDLATDTYQSQLRNKLVAEAFYLTKNIEKYGSGFLRIRKELESYPDISLIIEESSGGMVITFVRHGNTVGGANEGANEGVNEGVNALLTLIDKKPGLRAPELAHQLKAPAKTVERWLKQLRLENRIKFVGPSKTGGYYAT
jgi:ATP-dependent DNA helicase RecG